MENFDKIDRYLKGKMTEKERNDFEKAVASDKALAKEVTIQQFEEDFFDFAAEEDISAQIKKVQTEVPFPSEEKHTKILPLKKWWIPLLVAASVSILLLTGYIFQVNNYSNERLIAMNYKFDSSDMIRKGTTISTFTTANQLFEKGQYQKAIQNLEPYTQVDSTATHANYLIGHNHFNLKNYKEASQYFKRVQGDKNTAAPLLRDAQWFWLLSKIGMDEEDENFKQQLDLLIKEEYVGALELKKTLDSLWR